MAKMHMLRIFMLLTSIMAVVSLVAMFYYTVSFSQRINVDRKSGEISRVSNASTTHAQFTEGFAENHMGQNQPTRVLNDNLCQENVSTLVGPIYVNTSVPKMKDVERQMSRDFNGWVSNGGSWKPTECKAKVKMALIIPFRNRFEQLSIFVRHMHPLLKRQNLNYRIFVVEQAGDSPFNRAMLFNVGFKEALKYDEYECFIFHDVDLMPEDDRNEYSCPTSPRHMSVAVDTHGYRLKYKTLFGGVGSFLREHFDLINGFSNIFWGWGGEDDNLYKRIRVKGFNLTRPSMEQGRYKMIKIFHTVGKTPLLRTRVRRIRLGFKRMDNDGLNSLKYDANVTEQLLFTLIRADLFYDVNQVVTRK